MKIALYNSWSQNNKALADVSRPNHAAYAARHGYTHISEEVEWEECKRTGLYRVCDLLESFDAVLAHGSDVLFMNQTIRIENKTPMRAIGVTPVLMARERLNINPINNDVVIWTNNPESKWLCRKIQDDYDKWKNMRYLWQMYLWNLLITDARANRAVVLVEPNRLNASYHPGSQMWQLGDWIFHAVCGDLTTKIHYVKQYLQFVGDGTWPEGFK